MLYELLATVGLGDVEFGPRHPLPYNDSGEGHGTAMLGMVRAEASTDLASAEHGCRLGGCSSSQAVTVTRELLGVASKFESRHSTAVHDAGESRGD